TIQQRLEQTFDLGGGRVLVERADARFLNRQGKTGRLEKRPRRARVLSDEVVTRPSTSRVA
ncbi:MAG: hypothetical protein ACXWUK_02820, partial [Burkholderiales bacterium]